MKKMKKITSILSLLLLFTIASCTKFEEGSNFSIITVKARIVNDWKLSDYQVNGVSQPVNSNGAGLEMKFNKDNTFTRTWIYGPINMPESGTWTLLDGKTSILLTKADGSLEKYTIVQLKNNALKARSTDANGNTNLYIFASK